MIVASSELYHPTLDNFQLQSVRLGELISLSRLNENMTHIASCTLDAFHNDKPNRQVRISVSLPEIDPKGPHGTTYRTLVSFDGIRKPRYIFGEGSLQSLTLSLSFLRASLQQASKDGWTFRYPNTTDDLESELNLFGDQWIAPPDTDSFWDGDTN